jgi:hypothetical protein
MPIFGACVIRCRRRADHSPIAGSVAQRVTLLPLNRLLDSAQFAQPARLLRLVQRTLLAVFVDRIFGAFGLPTRVAPGDFEHIMAAHRAAADAQLTGVAVGIADYGAVGARFADSLLGLVAPGDGGVKRGQAIAVLAIAEECLVTLLPPEHAHHIAMRGGNAPTVWLAARVTIDSCHTLVPSGLLAC